MTIAASDLYQKLLAAFRGSPPHGVPPDGAQFGIVSGAPEEWACFGVSVAHAESGFDSRSENLSDPGGSFGIFQYSHEQAFGNAYDVDNSVRAFVRDANASTAGLRDGILGRRFSTIGMHPSLGAAWLPEARQLAGSTGSVPVAPAASAQPVASTGYLHAMPQTVAAFDALYGKLTWTEGGPDRGDITPDPGWVTANIVKMDIPQMHRFTRREPIECHRLIAQPLAAVFASIEQAGKLPLVLSYDGLWVPRHKDHNPSRGISLHSYGSAIDINAEWNPYGHVPAPAGAKGSCVELIPFFEAEGFAWGGYFGGGNASDTDGMHFEWTGRVPVASVADSGGSPLAPESPSLSGGDDQVLDIGLDLVKPA